MYSYEDVNLSNWGKSPSQIHTSNSTLAGFFRKYLMEKAFYPLDIEMPDEWDETYVMYTLFCRGYFAVINTDKFGVIPQECGLGGYGVMYQPTYAMISNPLLKGILEPKIGLQTEIVRLKPDWTGIFDIVSYYADQLALCAETVSVNVINSKLSYVFMASNPRQAASFKNMMDRIYSGETCVAVDRTMYDKRTGEVNWQYFAQNLKQNYISNDILMTMRRLLNDFDSFIGIGNCNTDKKERLTDDEVNANNEETEALLTVMKRSLERSFKKVNKMFPSVNLRIRERKDVMNEPESNNAFSGDVPI